ncbi:UNVERIFIED_CONTAM: hypothetical protein GTU68_029563 [Idotea baltica]|nr:hypothetical protein [Idotea baltica]
MTDKAKDSAVEDDNADVPQLSMDTMKALLEFYKEQEDRESKRKEIAEGNIPDSFDENWNMSQFWYTEETSEALAKECLRVLKDEEEIATVSCPTLYRSLRKLDEKVSKKVFEYDTRFAVYKEDFVFYDFKSPLDIPKDLRERFSVVVADPPYLNEDCLAKTAITIRFIAKPNAKIILCTGAVMEEMAGKLLKLRKCSFPIKHHKALSNPFYCYANYDLDSKGELDE